MVVVGKVDGVIGMVGLGWLFRLGLVWVQGFELVVMVDVKGGND